MVVINASGDKLMSDLKIAVSLNDVSLARSGVVHLQDITVDFPAATHTVILGENGSGKSTLLDVISGDLNSDHGTVSILGKDLQSYTLPELAIHRAYLKQHQGLGFDLSVFDVVKLGAINTEVNRDALVGAVLQALGLESLRDQLYPNLSGGEKQRVQIARVLTQCWPAENQICLLDEPMSSLDIRHQLHLLKLLKRLTRQGLTLVSVMHDLGLAQQEADFVFFIKTGKSIGFGPVREVFNHENVQKTFGVGWPLVTSDEKLQT